MKPFASILAIVGASAALLACAYKPESKEDLLSSSGFKILSLNTPAKVTAFKGLPAHRLTQTTFKGRQVWIYPDRNVCGCLSHHIAEVEPLRDERHLASREPRCVNEIVDHSCHLLELAAYHADGVGGRAR